MWPLFKILILDSFIVPQGTHQYIIDVLTIDDADKICAENGYPDTNVCNSNPYIL